MRDVRRLWGRIALVLAFLGAAAFAGASFGADAPTKKIVLIAGKKSHGPEGNGIHDYPWSVKLLKVMLDNSNVREHVRVETHFDGWPRDPSTLDSADAIMIISDGRDGDLYEEAPHFRNPAQLALIERQMRRGCGFLTFHFSTFAPDQYARQILDWSGGYFDWETDGQRKWYSAIRVHDTEVKLGAADHPIARGVKPFQLKEEFYYNLRFAENDRALSPLLVVPALGGREPDGNVVAWARTREDGGRGFGTTCGHFYDNWRNDNFRRFILNAVAWCAKVEVPPEGVQARFFDRGEIVAALEGKSGAEPATFDDRPIRALIVAGNEAHKWHNWEKTTVAIRRQLELDPRVKVDVTFDIEDLAVKKLSDYQVLVQNYANWHDPKGISPAARGALVGFLRGGGGLILVHFANGAFHFSLPMAGESDWPEYRKIVRRVWNHHGAGEAKSGHDAFGPFVVRPTDVKHPLTAGLTEFPVTDELYFRQDGDEPIEPLITARSTVTKRDEPLAWTYTYGEGRIFQTLLGHSEKTYDSFEPGEMLRRAVAWTARRTVVPREAPPPSEKPKSTANPTATPAAKPAAAPVTRPTLVEGKFGKALDARPAGVLIEATGAQRDAPLTVECWAKVDHAEGFQILLASEPKSSATHWELYSYAGSGVLSVYMPGRGGEYRSDVKICDGKWRHLVMALEADRLRLAVDGQIVLDRPVTGTKDKSTSGQIGIGRLVDGTIGCAGTIDDVHLRRGVHLPTNVATTAATVDDDTVGLWRFDEVASDGTTPDASKARLAARVAGTAGGAAPAAGGKPNRPIVGALPDHWGVDSVGFNWTEADSRDDRWSQMELGAFQASSLPMPGKPLRKGLSIRVGEPPLATLAFDTEQLKMRAAWTGGFLAFDPARYGLISPPRPAGPPLFAAQDGIGWDAPSFQYRGLRTHGTRVVLEYDVAGTLVREQPWAEPLDGIPTLTRTWELPATEKPLTLNLFDADATTPFDLTTAGVWKFAQRSIGPHTLIAAVAGEGTAWNTSADKTGPSTLQLSFAAQSAARRAKLWFAVTPTDKLDNWKRAIAATGPADSLARWLQPGPARWTKQIVTRGERSADHSAYVIDTLTLPHDNPYKALFFVGGHDFLPNGDAVLCTAHGDVWRVHGVNASLERLEWKRMATGLFQPLGLQVVDGHVHVLGRDQITALFDHDGDGEADEYRCVNNRGFTSYGGHDYVTCLEYDGHGWFYFVHATQGLVRASADGRSLEVMATGFRNPNGMGLGPHGELTVSPQEGEWVPGSNIALVRPGGYYGYGGPKIAADRPLGYDPPLCWIPRMLDNSSGGQTWVTSDRWGPLSGQLLHFSFGKCRMFLVPREQVGAQWQGGTVPFPLTFAAGAHRGRFNPSDGQLYVSGLKGWVSSAVQDGCLQRVRYTGRPVDLPLQVRTHANGLAITFARPLERSVAEDPENYNVEQWNYRYAAAYGSADWKVSDSRQEGHDTVDVRSATLFDDGRTVFLEIDPLRPAHQLVVEYSLRSVEGDTLQNALNYTIHAVAGERLDEKRLHRPNAGANGTAEPLANLPNGLVAELQQGDRRVRAPLRVASLAVSNNKAPVSGLNPGAFVATLRGYLLAPLRGDYQFRLEANGASELRIGGSEVLRRAAGTSVESAPVTLHKGRNAFELVYHSPADGSSSVMRVLWRGKGFGWEPIPSTALVRDRERPAEQPATAPAQTSSLDAPPAWFIAGQHGCVRCHADLAASPTPSPRGQRRADTPLPPSLDEWLRRPAPSLVEAGTRWRSDWLFAWLLEPTALRAQARMPHLFSATDAADRQAAADLVAFLQSLRSTSTTNGSAATPTDAAERTRGLALYEDLGCIACHRLTDEPSEGEPHPPRISLARVDAKFAPGMLAAFLRQPQAHDAWRRMPDFKLAEADALALETWLRRPDNADPLAALPAAPAGDATRGRALFAERRCAACHALDNQPPATTSVTPVRRAAEARPEDTGCLARDPSRAGRAPQFTLANAERTALTQWLTKDQTTTPTEFGAIDAARHFMHELRCESCHARDGRTSPRGLLMAEEGLRGLPPEVLPNLSWAGDKLLVSYLDRLFLGRESQPARTWLKARMPAFPSYATWLSQGLAAEHGWLPTDPPAASPSAELVTIGNHLTQKDALDCRQCHAVGTDQPRGDANTQIALGVNFRLVRQRVRHDYYARFVLNPPRYDVGTKMPVLAPDGRRTKVTHILDSDAARQFDAIWALIQSQ